MKLQPNKIVQSLYAALLVLVVANLITVFGQYKPAKDDPEYKLGDLTFQYPKYYKPKKMADQDSNSAFLYSEKYETYVFVRLLKSPSDLTKAKEAVKKSMLTELTKSKETDAKWKQSEKPYGSYGKYEVELEKWQTFSGQNRVFVETHYLKIKNQNILVGYAFKMDEGSAENAKAAFARGYDAGSGPAGAGCSTVIASITGEEDITIGMPPPAAGPPRPKN